MLHGSKVVPVYAMKAYRGSRGKAPLILNIGTRRRWMVKFKARSPLYRGEKSRWDPECVWSFWGRKIPCNCRESNPGRSAP